MDEVLEIMNTSLKHLFQEADILISRYTKEEAINHRLAVHIENNLKNINLGFNHSVDVEYNRNVTNDNRLFQENNLLMTPKIIRKKTIFGIENKEVIPDIIVHERGYNRNNFICIEAKKKYGHKSKQKDLMKIFGLLENPYNYKFGCLVEYLPNENHFHYEIIIKRGVNFQNYPFDLTKI